MADEMEREKARLMDFHVERIVDKILELQERIELIEQELGQAE